MSLYNDKFEEWVRQPRVEPTPEYVTIPRAHLRKLEALQDECNALQELLKSVETRAKAHRKRLLDLLAVIHRDGGHYVEAHGMEKGYVDAVNKVAALVQRPPAAPAAPTTSVLETVKLVHRLESAAYQYGLADAADGRKRSFWQQRYSDLLIETVAAVEALGRGAK